jgi:succinyl-CoA synthetase alpha subunit/GNAT superfamily N-acetyltransferase
VVLVRPFEPKDREELQQMFDRTSARSRYQRFLSPSRVIALEYLEMVCDPDRTLDAAVVVSGGRIVAIGSTHQTRGLIGVEVGLLIDDAHQGAGMSTLLLEELVARTRERGLTSMTARVAQTNPQIRQLLDDLGLAVHYGSDGPTCTATIDLVHGELSEATVQRHRHAAARSLDAFLRPGTIVVVGSPSHAVPAYHDVLAHLRAANSRSAVTTARVQRGPGREPWLSARRPIPDGIDLAIVAVRPGELHDAVRASLRAGVRAIAALAPAGDADSSSSAVDDLVATCAHGGVRLLGPGSSGLVNTDPEVRLDASTVPLSIRAGEVCLVAGSRRQAVTIAGLFDVMSVGVSTLVVLGEAGDINAADVLAYAAEDPRTRVAVVSLDGPTPSQLDNAGTNTDLTVVAYRPAGWAPSPLDPTSPPPGVVVTRTWMELADTVILLLSQPRPAGRETALVTTTPAASRDAELALEAAGQLPATVTQHTEMRTRLLAPAAARTGGSVIVPAGTDLTTIGAVLRTLAEDPGVDAIVCAMDRPRPGSPRLAETLDGVSRDHPDVTIVSAVPLTRPAGAPTLGRVPWLPDLQRVARALANVRRLQA